MRRDRRSDPIRGTVVKATVVLAGDMNHPMSLRRKSRIM